MYCSFRIPVPPSTTTPPYILRDWLIRVQCLFFIDTGRSASGHVPWHGELHYAPFVHASMRSTLKQVPTMYYLLRAMRPANAEHVRPRITMKNTGVANNEMEKDIGERGNPRSLCPRALKSASVCHNEDILRRLNVAFGVGNEEKRPFLPDTGT